MKYLVILLLAGCTSLPTWWYRDSAPVQVTQVIEHEYATPICNKLAGANALIVWGCMDRSTGTIHLQAGMVPALRQCTIEHEKTHAAGYNHPDRVPIEIACPHEYQQQAINNAR